MSSPGSPIQTFRHRRSAEALAEAKGDRRVTVCLPARDEQSTVGAIVHALVAELGERHGLVDEVIVVDDRSDDATAAVAAAAGARVLHGHGKGKGAAMQLGLSQARGDIVAFCDADLRHFDAGLVAGLLTPLVADGSGVGFVKGFYERPYEGRWGEGGRVTELVAKPLLRTLFPHLATLRQPLAGECCGRREVLEQVPFVAGYGVDIGLVIDVAARFGTGALAQADLGRRVHRNRPLAELVPQAEAVLGTVLARAGVGGPVAECPSLADGAPLVSRT